MISKIIDWSIRHKPVVLGALAVVCIAGWRAMTTVPVDAMPDLGERQVIILSRWERSPDIIENQVTYPIVTAMLGAPKVKTVRGYSDFGYSYVYVVFEDGTDLYWARSRTLEYLSGVNASLPEGVKTELGPDATGLGWVFQYALVDNSGKHSLADLRSYQDWYLRYQLRSVPGVADVAPIGGFTRQFQVNVDPNRLRAYGIPLRRVIDATRAGNDESSGRLLEFGGREYMVRGRGYARSIDDFANITLGVDENGSQIRVKDIGQVVLGPDIRRGVADLDGKGEVVSGIVIMRTGENALNVVERVKERIQQLRASFPEGVKLVPVYDRSELIHKTIGTAKRTVIEVGLTVALVIVIFLWHFPSAAIPIITMPVAVLLSFIGCRILGMSANLMSLAGIALGFSELVDASIVVAEQTHKKLEQWQASGRTRRIQSVVLEAIKEVAAPTFFALLVIAISFLPVLLLPGEDGQMFRPLAYTKTLTVVMAALLAITLDPALRLLLMRDKGVSFGPEWFRCRVNALITPDVTPEEFHPFSRRLMQCYEPVVQWTLQRKWLVITLAVAAIAVTVPIFYRLGSESMPQFDEGVILYMPATLPGVSIGQAQRLLQLSDRLIRQFPEVDHVLGKAGRAETATDPAPLSMLETVITLKPRSEWPRAHTWYSSWVPDWAKPALRHISSDTISTQELIDQMNAAVKIPGLSNSWTMPIRGRIDMLSSGIKTPLGLKITGSDLVLVQQAGSKVESLLRTVPGTRAVLSERTAEGYYLDVKWDREKLARYGVSVQSAQDIVQNAIGGENVSTVVLGPERYAVNVRYLRDFRSDAASIGSIPVVTDDGLQIPVADLAQIAVETGPSMIRDENGLLTGYVYVDLSGRDPANYIEEANGRLRNGLQLPVGYTFAWSGQYQAMQEVRERLKLVVPIAIGLICLLLYVNTGSLRKMSIVLLALPFSAVGAIWCVYLMGYNMSAAVWVGLIALLGIDAETGVFMLLYLELAYKDAQRKGLLRDSVDLRQAIINGAAKRVRPKFMTFAVTFVGLLPVMWATGTGSEVMKHIAAPMIGGIFASFILELLVYPPVYEAWRSRQFSETIKYSQHALGSPQPVHIAGD
jgi:Cu(I)/Ag(I) efflux system membrane protein CusA/SilA